MPIDRAATLKNAEKLLRQGKVEAAIAEYVRVVEDQPRDWNTANTLGDLYVRAGQTDKAVEQFTRIADSLSDEGFLPKAGALYKKILKIRPDHEHALIQGAEIAASQGLLADARAYLNTVFERRRARGDQRGAAQARIRLGSLDPADFEARANAARARVEINDAAGALRDLKEIAAELAEKGREADAVEVLREAALIDPEDEEIRERLLKVYIAAGDFARARECATTVEQFKALAAALEARQRPDEALAALRDAARLDPDDAGLKAHLAKAFVARGDLAAAAEYLTVETAGDDPQLLTTVAEIRLRGGLVDEGLAILTRLLDEDPDRRENIAMLGWTLGEQAPDTGFKVVELAAERAVAGGDWGGAAAALQEFVTRVPSHVPALMRLVEICVDGGLEATMYSAQAQLADAYIEAGSAAEARFIAEDLVAREPWERANIERFRRALVMLGEPDADAVIAERLSGQSPFMSTDLSLVEFPDLSATSQPDAAAAWRARSAPEEPAEPPPLAAARKSSPPPKAAGSHFELSANAIDLSSILGDLEAPPLRRAPKVSAQDAEVDLSVVLDDIASAAASQLPLQAPRDIDGVFEQMRGEASRQTGDAQEQYTRGMALVQAGSLDEAAEALQAASRTPRLRFRAASALAGIYRSRSQMTQAIEWFERAAQAPAPTPEEGHQLLYDLAETLESVGETARALAISMELQADAGDYRDTAARIDRLAKVQARG